MIDFRYHLVSLISVFLALAVGIVLGAGPLKDTIGDQLSGQVEKLRSEKDALREELKEAESGADNARAFQDAISQDFLDGQLQGKAVAIVVLPEVADETVEAVTERIIQAKGTVSTQVTIVPKWYEPGQRTFRQEMATTLLEGVENPPPTNAGQEADLAAVLSVGLTQADAADPTKSSELAARILDALKGSELLTIDEETRAPASGVVVIAPPSKKKQSEDEVKTEETSFMAIVTQAAQRTSGVVVAGQGAEGDDLLRQVRESKDLEAKVATVDSVDVVNGQLSVPVAFANAIAGKFGHYGFRPGATAIAPSRVATPIDPVQNPATENPADQP